MLDCACKVIPAPAGYEEELNQSVDLFIKWRLTICSGSQNNILTSGSTGTRAVVPEVIFSSYSRIS